MIWLVRGGLPLVAHVVRAVVYDTLRHRIVITLSQDQALVNGQRQQGTQVTLRFSEGYHFGFDRHVLSRHCIFTKPLRCRVETRR